MGKIFFFNVPAHGHVNPTLPVVTELVKRKHQVIYYNSETFEQAIQGTGAEFRSYPDSSTSQDDFAKRAHNLVDISVYILEESARLLPFLLDEIEREAPELVIFDSIALWGMAATRLKNISSIASYTTFVSEGVSGVFNFRDYLHLLRQAFTKLPALSRSRRQLVNTYGADIFPDKSIFPCKGNVNLIFNSREFQPDTPFIDSSFQFSGPSILSTTRKETSFPWDLLDPERTKIYLSLGTLYNNNIEFYHAAFTAFSDHPAQFILSIGHLIDERELGAVPDNFIIQSYVPQLDLLEKVDLFITHGGMNSVNEGLYYGVPLVVVPQQIEQTFNGRQVAQQGAGILLADTPPYGDLDAHDLRQTVDKVLADPSYRLNAERIGQSFHEAGGFVEAANIITQGL